MPWIPKKDALRKIREQRGFTIYMLAGRVGMSERQIRKIESDSPPGGIFGSNLYALANVLGCAKEDLAEWTARRPRKDEAPAEPEPPKRKRKGSWAKPTNLKEFAEHERRLRLRDEIEPKPVETENGCFSLLSAELLAECHSQFAVYENQRFVVLGRVEQHKPLTHAVAKMLGTETGVGARFQLGRDIAYDVPLFVTVFTTTAEHSRQLLDHARQERAAAVIARVHVARPKGHWKGFPPIGDRELRRARSCSSCWRAIGSCLTGIS